MSVDPRINLYTTALMPISQAVCWYFTLTTEPRHLYATIAGIGTFYCIWALYNRFTTVPKELGQFSMGAVAAAGYFKNNTWSIVGTGLVIINFLLPSYFIFGGISGAKLAKVFKKVDAKEDPWAMTWVWVLRGYFVSHLILWSVVIHKLCKMRQLMNGYASV